MIPGFKLVKSGAKVNVLIVYGNLSHTYLLLSKLINDHWLHVSGYGRGVYNQCPIYVECQKKNLWQIYNILLQIYNILLQIYNILLQERVCVHQDTCEDQ